jgi:hypothetical protein
LSAWPHLYTIWPAKDQRTTNRQDALQIPGMFEKEWRKKNVENKRKKEEER